MGEPRFVCSGAPASRQDLGARALYSAARPSLRTVAGPSTPRWLLVASLPVLLDVAASLFWQLAAVTGAVSRSAVAAPSDVIRAIGPLATTATFWSAVWD